MSYKTRIIAATASICHDHHEWPTEDLSHIRACALETRTSCHDDTPQRAVDKAEAYVDDPVVWGYHVFDEPGRKKVPYKTFVEKMQAFHKLDPTRPA
ncbi:MAG: hypothetical protein IID44_12935 [Planctomycetes bacterium]|nr:hypothetical protein [Planctomycetota bacterium]